MQSFHDFALSCKAAAAAAREVADKKKKQFIIDHFQRLYGQFDIQVRLRVNALGELHGKQEIMESPAKMGCASCGECYGIQYFRNGIPEGPPRAWEINSWRFQHEKWTSRVMFDRGCYECEFPRHFPANEEEENLLKEFEAETGIHAYDYGVECSLEHFGDLGWMGFVNYDSPEKLRQLGLFPRNVS